MYATVTSTHKQGAQSANKEQGYTRTESRRATAGKVGDMLAMYVKVCWLLAVLLMTRGSCTPPSQTVKATEPLLDEGGATHCHSAASSS
jgi:hypothetical protein